MVFQSDLEKFVEAALLDGDHTIHIAFGEVERRIERQFPSDGVAVKAERRTGQIPIAESRDAAAGLGHLKRAATNQLIEQDMQQHGIPHRLASPRSRRLPK